MSTRSSSPTPAARPHRPRVLIFVLGVLTAFAPLSIDMYLPSLPSIGRSLRCSPAQVQLTLATFMFGMGLGQLFYGPLSDRYGRRKPLLWGIALYALASLGCALAPNVEALIALRLLQALGGAAGSVVARAVVRDLYAGSDIARVLSIMTLVMGAAPILAPVLGGAVLAVTSWRAIFFVLTGIGVVAAGLAFWQVPHGTHTPPDAALLDSVRILLRDGRFMLSALAGAFAQVTLFVYIASAPFVFMTLRHVDAQAFSLIFGSNAVGFIAATQCNTWLLKRWTIPTNAFAAALWLCLAHAALLSATYLQLGTLPFAVCLFLCVFGLGLIFPNVTALALLGHRSIAGLASSLLGAIRFGAGAVAAAVVADGDSAYPMVIAMACGAGCTLATCARLLRSERSGT